MTKKKITRLTVGAMGTNCLIYPFDENEAIIIDPGDEPDKIISAVKNLNLIPKYILMTHGHFDHIAGLPDLARAFPQAVIAIHRNDSDYLGKDAYRHHTICLKAAMGDTGFLEMLWKEMPLPNILLEEGDKIGPLTVLHLPGHTEGSIAFWDKNEGVLFTGDTLFCGGYGRTDLPGGNENLLKKSLLRLFDMDTNTTVFPGHGDSTAIGDERAYS